MKTKKIVAVFGYNNTRIYDVKKIKEIVAERHSAEILLIKEGIGPLDLEVTPFCFDHRPDDPQMSDLLKTYLTEQRLELIGCLPFSDKGVIGAAHVARDFKIFGDDAKSSFAMVDKNLFRKLEAEIPLAQGAYKKPFFHVFHEVRDLFELLEAKGSYFIKPTSEGNSRGCMKIETSENLGAWLLENPSALEGGVICEEILANDNEYSFDGVAGNYWITQKFTTTGAYRAEYQHIVPAPFNEETNEKFLNVLKPLIGKLGSNGGAFHHEFFVLNDQRLASVEPNRRPAGMWIWDLASLSFEDFDPWLRWIDHCVQKVSASAELERKYFSGVRGIISQSSGKLSIDREKIEKELNEKFGEGSVRISFLKENNAEVRNIPRDNSDFLGLISLKNLVYEDLLEDLCCANDIFLKHTEVYV